ncbi:MAG: class I SAM-dependent methyltransferase [Candidatus Zixiibacteriota bacterium]|nr:MAG: class I SAM-dependent methyltransferase [candidate division Zixibacteria bacterium]
MSQRSGRAGSRKIFNKFASVYDRMGQDHFSVDMVDYTETLLRRFKIKPDDGLDLCCGTGTALKLFADAGIAMTGLDRSAAMLRQARNKLRGRTVKLVNQSLPRFRIADSRGRTVRFDLVTCFYDSLNYLRNERELKAAFRSVQRHLRPEGWFIFDMNTPEALKTIWGSDTYCDVGNKLAWIWRSAYHRRSKSSTLETTFFVKSGRNWKRFDETHVEHAYSNGAIRHLLRETGFQVKGFYDCLTFDKPTKKTTRICVVARRKDRRQV